VGKNIIQKFIYSKTSTKGVGEAKAKLLQLRPKMQKPRGNHNSII